MNDTNDMRDAVLDAIRQRHVSMRPKWHFLLVSILVATGALLALLSLFYISSLAVFFMHDSGVWYAPGFGGRGWIDAMRSVPLLLLLLAALFAGVLELLARRYAFAYRSPLVVSLGGILILVAVGGFALAQTSIHRRLAYEARHGSLPMPVGFWYGDPFRIRRPDDMYRGVIISRLIADSSGNSRILIVDPEAGTSTIVITAKTRLPYGEDFSPGDMIVVMGDTVSTGTVQAYGVRVIESDR